MTINTLAQLQAALPGRLSIPFTAGTWTNPQSNCGLTSFWLAAGATPPTGAGAVPTNATTGALTGLWTPGSGHSLYLAKLRCWGYTVNSAIIVLDRLVHTSGLVGNVTTVQTVNSVSVNRPDATGADANVYYECYSTIGGSNPNITVSYTNQAGIAGQIGTINLTGGIGNFNQQMVPMNMASGDSGVRSVQSVQLNVSAGSAGNWGITIARQIAWIPFPGNFDLSVRDHYELGLPTIPSTACLMLASPNPGSYSAKMTELTLVEG